MRRLARLIFNVSKCERISETITKKLYWLFPEEMFKFKVICLTYELLNGNKLIILMIIIFIIRMCTDIIC